ncbi:hypothetical protein BGX26_000357 [Mortierella sp. AD094]|nr:hypothetical protein BGX26_000357 [Mortierella sp. AD094]
MRFSTAFATFTSILLVSAIAGTEARLKSCGSNSDVMKVQDADVPPIKAGETACGSVSGVLEEPLTAGEVTITATYLGLTLHKETKDICSDTACPLKVGPQTILVCFDVPDNAPKDLTIQVVVTATNQNNNELFCASGDVVTQG